MTPKGVAPVENFNFATPAALRVTPSWRARVLNPISDQLMQDTYAVRGALRPFHNSISVPTGSIVEPTCVVSAAAGRVADGAAKQAAPPRGIPR
jgi:hypothetical protein